MTNVVQIKRSTATSAPSSLAAGELAYSSLGGAAVGKLYIGDPIANAVTLIGGAYVANQAANALPSASFTDVAVTAKVLTNYSSTTGTLASTDTILGALGKLNGNVGLKLDATAFSDTATTSKLITNFVTGAGTVAATDSILTAINKLDGNVALKLATASFTDSAVTGKALTGFGSTTGTITAADSILSAINKLYGNDALKMLSSDFTATAVVGKALTGFSQTTGTLSATDTIVQAISKLDGNLATKGTGNGTVTSIAVTTANGVSGSSSGGAAPSLTITLGAITPTTVNALTLAAAATGFTVAGGTTSKTLTVNETMTLSGTGTLNINGGGTLGTAAFTAATAYAASGASLSTFAAPTADISWNSKKITNLLDPTAAQDAATKNYVDNIAAGIDVKNSVRAATAAALPAYTRTGSVITASANGALAAVDGVTLVLDDRVLVKNGAATSDNGIYYVSQVGTVGTPYTLTRTADADTSAELSTGAFTFVEEGSTLANSGWIQSTAGPITLNTTGLVWAQFSGAGTYTGTTNSITLTGSAFSVASTYAGGTSIASVGTVTTGTWNAGVVAGQYGGTGVNNAGKTITLGGNVAFSGAYAMQFTVPGAYTYTLPSATCTLAQLGANTFTGAQTLPAAGAILTGATSGTTTLTANATASGTAVLPAGGGTLLNSTDTAAKATILANTRAIYGNNFDGSAALAQIIASTYGGTGNGFTKFSGPTTAEKTFTLPDASGTLPLIGQAQTWTGVQTYTNSTAKYLGGSTGVNTFAMANASASDYVTTFQAATGTVAYLTDISNGTIDGGTF